MESQKNMGFLEHVDELRIRIFRSLAVFMGGFLLCYFVTNPYVLEFLKQPLFNVLPPEQQKLYFTSLFENFLTHLKIAGYSSLFLVSPYFFSEIWGFIAPGLYPRERKWVVPFVLAATIFFIGGALFAYYVLFPVGFRFFVTFGAESDVPLLTIDNYFGTVLKLMLIFGLSFEFPVLVSLLGALGIVDSRALRTHRKTAILGITIFSAFSAPPDAISMLIMMAPLILMYEGCIWLVGWMGSRRARRKPATSSNLSPPDDPLRGQSR